MQNLTVSLLQPNLVWEDRAANLELLEQQIASLPAVAQVLILPEMFSTGFSMQVERLAESMDGPTIQWLRQMARTYRKIITGSMIAEENGAYFNRLIWMQPDGKYYHYDKRHLFAYAGEDKQYKSGDKRLVVQVNGWKVCVLICYDLRFPVWSRQTTERYDMLLYVANWPERRSHAWKTLLQARAIENQCYVAGVNRVGYDGHQVYHSGDSCLIDPYGMRIWEQADEAGTFTATLSKETLETCRTKFPFLDDADKFVVL